MISEIKNLECITLFVEDLAQAKKFYQDIFDVSLIYEDINCAVVKLQNVGLNLLKIAEAPELITPAKVAGPSSGSRLMFTVLVPDVHATCAQLKKHGVQIINGPFDRPWGRRTAVFCDPAGNPWEIAQEI